jgi:biotin operon repressor
VNFLLFINRHLARTGSIVYHFLIDFFWKERVLVSALRQMLYQRSLDIESRLDSVLQLIRHGGYSTPKLAERLGVSIPTVSRDVTALRQRGHDIRSTRTADGWSFVLDQRKPLNVAGETNSRLKEARA